VNEARERYDREPTNHHEDALELRANPTHVSEEPPMKIKVDFDLCESNALCEALAPEVFELDDDDYLQLKTDETTDATIESVRRAVAACPRAAISLED